VNKFNLFNGKKKSVTSHQRANGEGTGKRCSSGNFENGVERREGDVNVR
jgi:hypothetical protein